MNAKYEIVVIGGGYAGVMAANRLTKNAEARITLINPRRVFVPRLRMHQVAGGTHEGVVEYPDVLSEKVELVIGSVTRIDAPARKVLLADGDSIAYDYLVYAVGSGNAAPSVPGAAEFTHPVATLEAAQRLRSLLRDTPTSAPVTVIGGGPAGVETAAELAEQGRVVTLVCGGALVPYLHPKARRTAHKYLAKLGVTVLEGADAVVTAVSADAVELADGRILDSAVTIWSAGFSIPDLAVRSGLSTDAAGRMLTDETLTSIDDERIVAAGDSSAPSELPFRMSAYTAYSLGAHAADTLLRRIAGESATPIDMSFPAMCLSFGRNAGIYQIGRKNETATRVYASGSIGRKLKEFACSAGVTHLSTEADKPGSHHWFKDGKYRPSLLADQANTAIPVA
ncbi:NAD(P)/FAD-dependent oxidoreductase [Nocardia sp. NPDC127526]|uniref:NAD(P)/FAD-dependent oxidoreductase n=1 Tax=Nocardia sp. NPDC127526 TaxID=3345393 RepID=UPI00362989D9